MKKFTFIAMLMLIFCGMAKADDKYFFKVPTDRFVSGWVVQDAGNFESTPGKEYLEVYNKKNGGRMLNYFWNEDAWSKVDVNNLPNNTYKFTMDLNMNTMAVRSDMEFDLLPVNACTATDARVATHNYHWFNNEGEDYFFRFRVGTAPTAANGDFTILINENPTARDNWPTEADNSCVLSSQKTYKFAVSINVVDKTATYTITDEDGNQVANGVHNYVCAENRVGIFVFAMNGTSRHQLSNIGLSYEVQGPFANEPSVDLLAAIGERRAYYVSFGENETLHWQQLGDQIEPDESNSYTDGEEYEVEYADANDKTDFDKDPENISGKKVIYCGKSGDLRVWTTLAEDPENKSDEVVTPVACEVIPMPNPTAAISNVSEGYAKEYTLTADNSETLMQPEVTIHYAIKDASGNKVSEGDAMTGEKVTINDKGSLEIYSYDGKHPDPWYGESDKVTVENNAEYEKTNFTNYAWTKDECSTSKAGFSVVEIIDNANKSHWDRIYSTQKYGYDENGTASAYVEGTEYASVKEGFGFYEGSSIGTDDAKWNVQVPDDATTAFAPLAPTSDFTANSKYVASAWNVFPLEGIVYYNTALNNAVLTLDPKYTSDDAAKPNFYVVHTRGGYDRPDKGDCNKTTVCVAGENFNLYRYDTALCDVTVMTYKGFVPGTGISSVNVNETTAPAVKKIVTKNGIQIVKGNKVYSVSGAQIK